MLNVASQKAQLPIKQVVFAKPSHTNNQNDFEIIINDALEEIEEFAFTVLALKGFYPLSMSSYTQVYKGRLVSNEVFPYFKDLLNPEHKTHSLFFHMLYYGPVAGVAFEQRKRYHANRLERTEANHWLEGTVP